MIKFDPNRHGIYRIPGFSINHRRDTIEKVAGDAEIVVLKPRAHNSSKHVVIGILGEDMEINPLFPPRKATDASEKLISPEVKEMVRRHVLDQLKRVYYKKEFAKHEFIFPQK